VNQSKIIFKSVVHHFFLFHLLFFSELQNFFVGQSSSFANPEKHFTNVT